MRDFARLLVEFSASRFPNVPIRQALRVPGGRAPATLLDSTVGKAVLGSAALFWRDAAPRPVDKREPSPTLPGP